MRLESKDIDTINPFIYPIIIKKKKHDFKAWIEKRKIIKYLNTLSPSFHDMMDIYYFLELISKIYMYNNDNKFHLFIGSIKKNVYNSNNTYAMIYKETGFEIKYVLSYLIGANQINIEIIRNNQNKNDKDVISFNDGEYKIKNKYDEEKMLFITSCLINGLIELIEYYYKNKKL